MQRCKIGTCDVHRYLAEDESKRKVTWNEIKKMWICNECESQVVLQVVAEINRNILIKNNPQK